MSHQTYIDYLNSIKSDNISQIANNNTQINAINDAITSLQNQITQYQQQIVDLQTNSSHLANDNVLIDDIIALL
jgi:TolA-binding protein